MKTYFVDSFTNEPFKGNPAAVCLVQEDISPDTMQLIAKEIGFSETAFVKKAAGTNTYHIRYFSPKKEIPLCGHATLASAKIIFATTGVDELLFITGEEIELQAKKEADQIVMRFPVYDTTPFDVPSQLLAALGIKQVTRTAYCSHKKIILIEMEDAAGLAALRPDFNALVKSYDNINGVLVTAVSNMPGSDFHYRYFWPWSGTHEDPVTGGVQSFLAKYWSQQLNKKRMNAFQSSERTGIMTVEWQDDKVLIFGHAVIVLEGEFNRF